MFLSNLSKIRIVNRVKVIGVEKIWKSIIITEIIIYIYTFFFKYFLNASHEISKRGIQG